MMKCVEMGGHTSTHIDMCPSETTLSEEDPYMHKVMEEQYLSTNMRWTHQTNVQRYLPVLMAENSCPTDQRYLSISSVDSFITFVQKQKTYFSCNQFFPNTKGIYKII